MAEQTTEFPFIEFRNLADLRAWLEQNHASSGGVWVRLYKKSAGVESISFEDLLDEGLCFGWSESARQSYDAVSYLQKFTPRRTKGTVSERNKRHAAELIRTGRMTQAGLDAL